MTTEAHHDFSSTQVDLPPSLVRRIRYHGRRIPATDLAEDGREQHPHITVKYGLHTNDAADVAPLLTPEPPVHVRLGKTALFPAAETGADYDVLMIPVESPDLHRINGKLTEALPHTDTHPTYQPHITIAYLKPGRGQAYTGHAVVDGQGAVMPAIDFSDKDGKVTRIPLRQPSHRLP